MNILPKIAVLGTGSIGMRHLRIFAGIGAATVAVPVRRGRAAKLRAEGFETAKNLADAVRQGASACVIATDTGRHLQDALNALGLGMHVLVEKPLARDARQAKALATAAARARRRAFTACVLRFSGSLGRARRLLPRLGKLHAVSIECRSYLPDWHPGRDFRRSYSARASEGGILRDMIHEVDYAGWLFGWPREVQGRLKNFGRLRIAAEESAELIWENPKGVPVVVGLDYLSRPTRRSMVVRGERGTLTWDGVAGTVLLETAGNKAKLLRLKAPADDMYRAQARAFLAALSGKSDERLATALEGAKALGVCDAARRASRYGRVEKVKLS